MAAQYSKLLASCEKDSKLEYLKVEKGHTVTVRLVPFGRDKLTKDWLWYKGYNQHKYGAGMGDRIFCTGLEGDNPCPICQFYQKYKYDGDGTAAEIAAAFKLFPSAKAVSWVVKCKENEKLDYENLPVQVYDYSTSILKSLYSAIVQGRMNIYDPVKGNPICISSESTGPYIQNVKYTVVAVNYEVPIVDPIKPNWSVLKKKTEAFATFRSSASIDALQAKLDELLANDMFIEAALEERSKFLEKKAKDKEKKEKDKAAPTAPTLKAADPVPVIEIDTYDEDMIPF
jgi:hypothetical protein